MPRGPDKASGNGFVARRKTSETTEEIKEENEDEVEVEKCVASTSAELDKKVRIYSLHLQDVDQMNE